jgi:hypothetical protein
MFLPHMLRLVFSTLVATTLFSLSSTDAAKASSADLVYTGSSGLLKVGKAFISIKTNQNSFSFVMSGKSAGVLGLVDWKANIQSIGKFNGRTPVPMDYTAQTIRKGKAKKTRINFSYPTPRFDITPSKIVKPGEQLNLSQLPGASDPGTAMMKATQILNETGRCNSTVKMFDGRSIVKMTLRDVGSDRIAVKAYRGKARKCVLYITPMSGRIMRTKTRNNIQPATIWFAQVRAGHSYVPVKISTSSKGIPLTLQLTKAKLH